MNDELALLGDTLRSIFTIEAAHRAGGAFDPTLWDQIEEIGLVHLALPSEAGGGDGTIEHAHLVLRTAAGAGTALPLLETQLAGAALHVCGRAVPAGVMSFASSAALDLTPRNGGWSVRGSGARVPWGTTCGRVVCLTQPRSGPPHLVVLDADAVAWQPGRNVAGEPRDSFTVDTVVDGAAAVPLDAQVAALLRQRESLGRAVMLVGASETALALTLVHVQQRAQFGRALSSFQVVQHQVAEMASLVVAAAAATDAATGFTADADAEVRAVEVAVLSAKSQANRSAGRVARLAHQLHGAIGFTDEHVLSQVTTRLWAWRQEGGTELECDARLGVVASAGDPWLVVTGVEPATAAQR